MLQLIYEYYIINLLCGIGRAAHGAAGKRGRLFVAFPRVLCYNNNINAVIIDFPSLFSPLTRQPKSLTNYTIRAVRECYLVTMKKLLSLVMLLALCLALCACGKGRAQPAEPGMTIETPVYIEPTPTPGYSRYDSIPITMENWATYFEISEVPLFILNPNGGVRELVQNYCITLREEFMHRMRMDGSYQVAFTVAFDVYVDTLDIDLDNRSFVHTDDLLYALRAEHECSFTARALPKSAAGGTYGDYLFDLAPQYRNAFFSGSAHYSDGVWAGFYVDLATVQIVSVSGTLELGI